MPDTTQPTAAALQAAEAWYCAHPYSMRCEFIYELALIIDRETKLPELLAEVERLRDALEHSKPYVLSCLDDQLDIDEEVTKAETARRQLVLDKIDAALASAAPPAGVSK